MAPDSAGPRDRIVLARIGAAHGVRGEVKVKTFTDDPQALGRYGPLRAEDGRVLVVEKLRPDKAGVIVRFRGVDDRDAAQALSGLHLLVDRAALPAPEEDEFYHADLIGLEAVSPDGIYLGTVAAIHDFGAGDVIDISPKSGRKPLLVPFTKACVPDINLASGRITIVVPDEIEARPEDEAEEEP